jgi:ABC-type antimicrobial peptide transport system permease subunit
MVTLFALGGALLLLLAGANVGNLLLFRGARRRGEMAVRSALGASRWRLLRAHLIEVSLISLSGGAVGLVLTFWLGRVLGSTVIPDAGLRCCRLIGASRGWCWPAPSSWDSSLAAHPRCSGHRRAAWPSPSSDSATAADGGSETPSRSCNSRFRSRSSWARFCCS